MNTQIISSNIVYILCTLTALACAALLLRGYLRSRARLLLWAGGCFALLAINNALVFVDMVNLPEIDLTFWEIDLSFWRTLPAMVGVGLLIYGLVWEGSRDA